LIHSKAPPKRVFFALNPGTEVREALNAVAATEILPRTSRPTAVENLHLTLLFIGKVNQQILSCLLGFAGADMMTPFELTVDRLEGWKRPGILWLGCRELPSPVTELVNNLIQFTKLCGVEPDERPFKAHITVARRVGGDIWSRLPRSIEAISWPINEFVLMESLTNKNGTHYEVLKTWRLGR